MRNAQAINAPSATKKVTATNASATVAIAANLPVHLYRNAAGTLLAANAIVDGSSVPGKWGITMSAIASGAITSDIVIQGSATIVSGATSGELVTSIAADGTVTDAAAGSANTDLAIAVSTGTTTLTIY